MGEGRGKVGKSEKKLKKVGEAGGRGKVGKCEKKFEKEGEAGGRWGKVGEEPSPANLRLTSV